MNPGGSMKDRIGLEMVNNADLKEGQEVLESTSGNTGVGVALACAIKGHKCHITIPAKMSKEKVSMLKVLGC
jgi:cysteine synthase